MRAEATIANRHLVPPRLEASEQPIMFELTQTAELSHWVSDRSEPTWRAFWAGVRQHLTQNSYPMQANPPGPVGEVLRI